MTWKEFKEAVEAQGMTDGTELMGIDWSRYDDDSTVKVTLTDERAWVD